MCLPWILCSSNFYLLQTCPPLILEALCCPWAHIHILHTTLQLLAKKTPISLLMLLLFGKTKREKAAEHSSVLPGNAVSSQGRQASHVLGERALPSGAEV